MGYNCCEHITKLSGANSPSWLSARRGGGTSRTGGCPGVEVQHRPRPGRRWPRRLRAVVGVEPAVARWRPGGLTGLWAGLGASSPHTGNDTALTGTNQRPTRCVYQLETRQSNREMSELIANVASIAIVVLLLTTLLLILQGLYFFGGFVLSLVAFAIYFREIYS